MRVSISLIYLMFILLLGLVCAWAVYASGLSRPYEARRLDGDTYPTSIAVLDRLHRDAFLALRKGGLQQEAWVEGVDWQLMGGRVTIALASPDKAKAATIVKLVGAHPGVDEVAVRVVADLKARAAARLKADGLDKYALVEGVRGRVPLVKLTDETAKTSAAVARSLGQVRGLLWRNAARTYFGNLRQLAADALRNAGLGRLVRVGRADGRILHLQVASADSATARKARKTAGGVPGVLRVQLSKISLESKDAVTEAGACDLLLRAVKDGGRIRFLPKGSQIDKASHPLLDRIANAISRCKKFIVEVGGHMDKSRRGTRAIRDSGNRANAVVDYLVTKGIERRRLRAQAYGSRQPLASNATEAGRKRNRRIEFKTIAAGGSR
jgi:outer membrane protein OmpA-like peptidoglycan-associated protein